MREPQRTRQDLRDLVLLSKFGSQTPLSPLPLKLAYKCVFLQGCVQSLEGFLGIHELAPGELVHRLGPKLCCKEAPRDGELCRGTPCPQQELVVQAPRAQAQPPCSQLGTGGCQPGDLTIMLNGVEWTRQHFLGADEGPVPEHTGRLP